MEKAREKFFTKDALTESALREKALTEYETTADEMSQMHKKLQKFISEQYSSTSTMQQSDSSSVREESVDLPPGISPETLLAVDAVANYYAHQRRRSENNENNENN